MKHKIYYRTLGMTRKTLPPPRVSHQRPHSEGEMRVILSSSEGPFIGVHLDPASPLYGVSLAP